MCGLTGNTDLMGYYVTTYGRRKHQASWVSGRVPTDPVPSSSLSNFVAKLLKSLHDPSCLHGFTSHLTHHASVYRPAPAEDTQ